ncbi:hypothetical protein, partial [Pseudomonas sp. 250J]|uniref:hypothetical protein n=1 Tax=Pseudomonas sp. 250J TaxID=1478142 RepID=UPI001C493D10
MIEAPPQPSSTINSLILKEFFVPMSLEVGRIIRGSDRASTVNFIKVKYREKRPRQGLKVFAESLAAPIRSSAARAALDLIGAIEPSANTSGTQRNPKANTSHTQHNPKTGTWRPSHHLLTSPHPIQHPPS